MLYFLYSAFSRQPDACTRRVILPPAFQAFTLPSLPLPSLPPLSWKAFTRIQVDCPHSMRMKSGEIGVLFAKRHFLQWFIDNVTKKWLVNCRVTRVHCSNLLLVYWLWLQLILLIKVITTCSYKAFWWCDYIFWIKFLSNKCLHCCHPRI